MAHPLNDQIYTKSFTPREYQVELFYAARNRDIVVCLGKNSEQTFLVIKLIQEFATNNRRKLSEGGKRSVYILRNREKCLTKETYIRQLTDLRPLLCEGLESDLNEKLDTSHVLLATSKTCARLFRDGNLGPEQINLVIVDECHKSVADDDLSYVVRSVVGGGNERARVIGLAVPLFGLTHEPGRLESELERLEATLQCQVETASDILSILRYSPRPREYVIEHRGNPAASSLESSISLEISKAVEFLADHRHDPREIYTNDEFLEDIERIPDPKEKPFEMLRDLLEILESLGPWCADRAALSLLYLTEKLKVKTPYERHYLLLNMISSVLIKIRAICDGHFAEFNEKDRIYRFASPKVHRILEILKCYDKRKPGEEPRRCRNEEFHGRREKRSQRQRITDPDLLCGVIFVDKPFVAKVLFYLLNEISSHDDKLGFLSPLYTVERSEGEPGYSKDVEIEHRKQEEVLKRFRIHECNLLISTAVLEEGIDIPKCNFVMRYDFPRTYQSYVQCKSRARAVDAVHVLLVPEDCSKEAVRELARYRCIEKTLLSKCSNDEPTESEEIEADAYSDLIPCYKPVENEDGARVTFNSAISLVNRYCAKLPSDTFTRLTPEWKVETDRNGFYTCSLRLPINSPLKYTVNSYPMPNRAMARRMAALQLCADLHRRNEIDDNLLPIGKENFKARPEDTEVPALPDEIRADLTEARPGTTKRRQYYYKKTAEALTDCRPRADTPAYLYHVSMVLSCPLPEEQNTRGRRIYPPEESAMGFGIVTLKMIPKLCPFPIYTRSGEVRVELRLSEAPVPLDDAKIERIAVFLNYTFTNVLRLQQYLMLFDDPNASENSYMIVPVRLGGGVAVDWEFLECIYENRDAVPTKVPETVRRGFRFDARRYHDAVIMPWYRSQDQPQYFYVAEICTNLNPRSAFPGDDYTTFEEYYSKKYGIRIQNLEQPLLDVDHTSARLNFLTPRYVNRKGVALPTSSEETKRAKRENLEQKQILVAELCSIHPFPASLWRQAVCLPCILYRINALLLADQIRCQVARTINLGREELEPGFEWPPLDFGWSLTEVLKRAKEAERAKKPGGKDNFSSNNNNNTDGRDSKRDLPSRDVEPFRIDEFSLKIDEFPSNNNNNEKKEGYDSDLEIGTWSSELITELPSGFESGAAFPVNFTSLPSDIDFSYVRSASPNFGSDLSSSSNEDYYLYSSGGSSYEDEDESENEEDGKNRFKIAYTSENVAEAVEDERRESGRRKAIMEMLDLEPKPEDMVWPAENNDGDGERHRRRHLERSRLEEERIIGRGFVGKGERVDVRRKGSGDGWRAEENFERGSEGKGEPVDVRRKGFDECSTGEGERARKGGSEASGIAVDTENKGLDEFSTVGEEDLKDPGKKDKDSKGKYDSYVKTEAEKGLNEFSTVREEDSKDPGKKDDDSKGKYGSYVKTEAEKGFDEFSTLEEENFRGHEDDSKRKYDSCVKSEAEKGLNEFSTVREEDSKDPGKKDDDSKGKYDSYVKTEAEKGSDEFSTLEEENFRGHEDNSKRKYDSCVKSEAEKGLNEFSTVREEDSKDPGKEDDDSKGKYDSYVKTEAEKGFDEFSTLEEENLKGREDDSNGKYDSSVKSDTEKDKIPKGASAASGMPVDIEQKNFNEFSTLEEERSVEDNSNRKYDSYIRRIAEKFQKESKEAVAEEKREGRRDRGGERCAYNAEGLFSFDYQPELGNHPGPSPSLILQALTMSNANDGINLERLETIGDSFLKYAITTYLYCTYENIHEGKLSHLRSKQVSNLNLYRLGRRKCLGESMIATKFEPHDNWLPPCYYVPKELEQALIESGVVPSSTWAGHDFQIVEMPKTDGGTSPGKEAAAGRTLTEIVRRTELRLESIRPEQADPVTCFIPYNLITQHSIPDKSIADCVEALIGAYLIACGPRGALLFMAWLGIHVLPTEEVTIVQESRPEERIPGSTPYEKGVDGDGRATWTQTRYGRLEEPQNPLLRYTAEPEDELKRMLDGYEDLERSIGYKFRDISYLLQAFTHASYQPNRLTDCYQRLEFLGDAVLDYLITRHLYEDARQHSPGALTDLRSALVNNTIFASLAVRCGFHKYFRHLSPGLCVVINRFVRIQEENGHSISEEYYLIGDEECEEAEDVEVPKALGDVFESLAGAIYLDSGMSLDAVWSVYYAIMRNEIEQFSTNVPKSPIRELLELEPETAKFGKPEKLADGRRVRVTVDVFGKGSFKGIGRNYRIAKCTAAKCALKKLKRSQSGYHKEKL